MKTIYVDSISTIEKLHRLFLDVVKTELDRQKMHDINNVQAVVLYNIGDQQLTVGELTNKGFYLGSNVSYNLKKMVQNGYIAQIPSSHDRRSSHVKLSAKGLSLYKKIDDSLHRQVTEFNKSGVNKDNIEALYKLLKRLETFWTSLLTR